MQQRATTTTVFELTDIPRVSSGLLDQLVMLMVTREDSDFLFREVTVQEKAAFEQAFWDSYDGEIILGGAALLRFWALMDVMTSARLREKLLGRGFGFMKLVVGIVATQRLNFYRGFNPLHILWAIDSIDVATGWKSRSALNVGRWSSLRGVGVGARVAA